MDIEIRKEVFTSADFGKLNFLIQILTFEQRYLLFVAYPFVKNTEAFMNLTKREQSLIGENFLKFKNNSKKAQYFITLNPKNTNEFNIDEAIRFFIQPVSIILENSLNDSHFIKAIIQHFDSTQKIQKHLDNGWLQFENAGGCTNVPNYLESKKQSFNYLAARTGKENGVYLRCLVILDSDKAYPNVPMRQDRKKIIDWLDKNNLIYHLLEKREMENYIPNEVLVKYQDKDEFIKLYLRLKPIQKDFFDLHKGFAKNRSDRNYDSNILGLFRDVTDNDWKVLKNGIKLPPYDEEFKSEFPKLFQDEEVNKETLFARIKHQHNPDEFQEILSKISKLL